MAGVELAQLWRRQLGRRDPHGISADMVAALLEPGETVQGVDRSRCDDVRGVLVLTSRRVLFVDPAGSALASLSRAGTLVAPAEADTLGLGFIRGEEAFFCDPPQWWLDEGAALLNDRNGLAETVAAAATAGIFVASERSRLVVATSVRLIIVEPRALGESIAWADVVELVAQRRQAALLTRSGALRFGFVTDEAREVFIAAARTFMPAARDRRRTAAPPISEDVEFDIAAQLRDERPHVTARITTRKHKPSDPRSAARYLALTREALVVVGADGIRERIPLAEIVAAGAELGALGDRLLLETRGGVRVLPLWVGAGGVAIAHELLRGERRRMTANELPGGRLTSGAVIAGVLATFGGALAGYALALLILVLQGHYILAAGEVAYWAVVDSTYVAVRRRLGRRRIMWRRSLPAPGSVLITAGRVGLCAVYGAWLAAAVFLVVELALLWAWSHAFVLSDTFDDPAAAPD